MRSKLYFRLTLTLLFGISSAEFTRAQGKLGNYLDSLSSVQDSLFLKGTVTNDMKRPKDSGKVKKTSQDSLDFYYRWEHMQLRDWTAFYPVRFAHVSNQLRIGNSSQAAQPLILSVAGLDNAHIFYEFQANYPWMILTTKWSGRNGLNSLGKILAGSLGLSRPVSFRKPRLMGLGVHTGLYCDRGENIHYVLGGVFNYTFKNKANQTQSIRLKYAQAIVNGIEDLRWKGSYIELDYHFPLPNSTVFISPNFQYSFLPTYNGTQHEHTSTTFELGLRIGFNLQEKWHSP